jgi:serine protease AprX
MKRKASAVSVALLLLALVSSSLSLAAQEAPAAAWQAKVDPWVLNTAAAEGQTEFLVFLASQADLSGAAALSTKLDKGTYVYETLSRLAAETQGPALAELQARGVEHRAYWVANMIWVRGGADTVEAMARRADVAHIYANPTVQIDEPAARGLNMPAAPAAIEWNITKINAPQVWAAGFTGQGAVIGGQDTGYQWDHPALKGKYRGWDGVTANHDYSWHDSIHSGGGSCGANALAPCDDNAHGTHTMGTMVGDDGATNQIGVAPGARWIGCRNMDQGAGTPTTYSECYQWFIAPTTVAGTNPDPSKAPDVINNSWGCPASEGCTDPNVMLTVVNNVRAAGIVTVHSAGNSGSSCSTIAEPSAIYDSSFTVGSTTSGDAMSGFSSRGPVTVDGSNRRKPDVSAPGSNIRSSVPGGGYQGGWSGTSMAGPHVAGAVALVLSVRPDWNGNVDQLEAVLEQSAVHITLSQTCGGIPPTTFPNNVVGHGRIDVYAAYLASQPPSAVALSGLSVDQANLPLSAPAIPLTALPAAALAALAAAGWALRRRTD